MDARPTPARPIGGGESVRLAVDRSIIYGRPRGQSTAAVFSPLRARPSALAAAGSSRSEVPAIDRRVRKQREIGFTIGRSGEEAERAAV